MPSELRQSESAMEKIDIERVPSLKINLGQSSSASDVLEQKWDQGSRVVHVIALA